MRNWPLWLTVLAGVVLAPSLWADPGDVNGDGKADQYDLQVLQQYLKGKALLTWPQTQAADLNEDGLVDQQDVALLQQHLAPKSIPAVTAGRERNGGGRVIDQKTGQPLAGAVVAVPDEKIQVTTDDEGRFTLPQPVKSDRILTVKAGRYAPFSLTLNKEQGVPQQLGLEQLTARVSVLDDEVRHLGDDAFDPSSANAGDFRLPTEGTNLRRTFSLTALPDQDPYLKIGSLIGIDTPDSVLAGQSKLPAQNTFRDTPTAAFRVYLNGTLAKRITVNGDNVIIPLPRWLLKLGTNEVVLATASSDPGKLGNAQNLDGALLNRATTGIGYDDIELAHVLLVIPNREERTFFTAQP
ncbi:dockerin type I domain-containing protein [Anthocerotibacter panamensis]|uniref:dockerin type I domain-containing protein n=1 Tax=Anthocerotibacter panamensis TaxID=2857077 RepID=UPI001C405581|nr:dockerin type I domain-containing protein [Anthocerotibacter panamensis]